MKDLEITAALDQETTSDIQYLDSLSALRVEVDQGFEDALKEMDSLQSELDGLNGEDLVALCKENLIGTVVSQFGLASLLVDSRDGGAVTTTHNFDKGITSTAQDQTRYEEMRESRSMSGNDWSKHRRGAGYDSGFFNDRKKQAYQENEILRDGYTGRVLTKDGRTHLDHVVSAREIDTDARMNLHLSRRERVDLAKSEENLVFTAESINKSKSDHKMENWLEKTNRQGEANHERYGIDKERALDCDATARKTISREVDIAAAKKYTSELMATGARDAANMAYYTAFGILMKELSEGAVLAIKKAFSQRDNGLGAMLEVFKGELTQTVERLKSRWKDIAAGSIEAGITAFLSNIVVFLVNLFATTLKKIVTMIRAGFVSLVQALKIIARPPQGMSQAEARFEALKVLTAGVIGALSLGLSAMIEKALQAIPGLQPVMMFTVYSTEGELTTVSDILAVTLSGVAGGLLATVAIYLLDQLRNGAIANKLQIQLVTQSGVLVEYSAAKSWMSLYDAYEELQNDARTLWNESQNNRVALEASSQTVRESREAFTSTLEKLKQRRQKL